MGGWCYREGPAFYIATHRLGTTVLRTYSLFTSNKKSEPSVGIGNKRKTRVATRTKV